MLSESFSMASALTTKGVAISSPAPLAEAATEPAGAMTEPIDSRAKTLVPEPAGMRNASRHALRAGALVSGRYRLLELLGAGGSACVYRARDRRLGHEVAVKVLHPHLSADRELVERFRGEARIAAGLNDGHVAKVYELGRWDGTEFIAMEYAPGPSLKSLVREEAPVDPLRAIDLGVQLLKAVRSIHDRGIVHRDIKPANAIIGREGRLKVIDFGIAHSPTSDLTTTTDGVLGTARYASPEQALGQEATAASDLYSIGVILYELLAGRPPFEAEGVVALALEHVHKRPPALDSVKSGIPPRLASAVMRALRKNPGERFANAAEFAAALGASAHTIKRRPRRRMTSPTFSRSSRSPSSPARPRGSTRTRSGARPPASPPPPAGSTLGLGGART